MARVKARARVEEATLEAEKFKLERLCSDVSELDAQITSNALEAVEKRANAEALQKEAKKTRAEEALRKAEILKAVESADRECQGR